MEVLHTHILINQEETRRTAFQISMHRGITTQMQPSMCCDVQIKIKTQLVESGRWFIKIANENLDVIDGYTKVENQNLCIEMFECSRWQHQEEMMTCQSRRKPLCPQ